jgi:HK97 family phage portal protein
MTTALVLPNGAPLTKAVTELVDDQAPQGKGRIVGISPWRATRAHPWDMRDAVVKAAKWDEYNGMYEAHAYVRGAIDKIAKAATFGGFDLIPRHTRTAANEGEVAMIQAFFDKQPDFTNVLRTAYKQLLISGDAYIYIVPDRLNKPALLKTLHPKTMHVQINQQGRILGYAQKNLDEIGEDSDPVFFEPHEIIHIKIDNPNDDIYGLSPLESLKWAVGTDLYAQRYNASFFANSGVTGTIIGVKNADSNEVERNRKWIEENYMGPEGAHRPIILEGESISIGKSVATHTEMGFLDGRTFIIQEILAVLDVPPAKLGRMESANRSNSKEQDQSFRSESVAPLQWIVEAAINGQFIRPILGATETVFVHAEGNSRDQIEQMEYYTKAEAWGILNPNEIRKKIGYAPVDGGDTNIIMTPTGAVPLDRLDLYFQLPKTNVDTVPASTDDPASGEPPPKRTPNTTQETVGKSKADSVYTAISLLKSATTKGEIAMVYSYLNDALDLQHDGIIAAHDSIRKALTTTDNDLATGYIRRATQALKTFEEVGDS